MLVRENHVAAKTTERLHPNADGLDQRPAAEIASLLANAQIQAAKATRNASDAIAKASSAMAQTIRNGGCLHYVAAGSSGLMAAADAQELGGTFSIPSTQVRIHMAGGLPTGVDMPGDTEDDTGELKNRLQTLTNRDTVIAISASGTTPYTLAAARIAKAHDAKIIGIANNPNTPLLGLSDHPIALLTPPEVLSGSTRMGAGTAQKITLNMLSTLMAVELGHVHDGMMVNLHADNTKLKERAAGIVARIADVPHDTAIDALGRAAGKVKPAVLMAAGDVSPDVAANLLIETGGQLRPALRRLN